MPIRITGLNSGLDTESIISALVSSYSYKTDKYKKAQTKLSWKQDAWKELNTKIYSLYKNVGNLRLESSYNLKSATVSDSTKVSVTAGANAVNGSYSVQVTQLAKSAYLTGAKVQHGTKATTKLSELGYTGKDTEITLSVGGKEQKIKVTKDTTIQEIVTMLRNGGNDKESNVLNASFDEGNGRFFVSAKKSGAAGDFELSANDSNGEKILTLLGLNTASSMDYEELAKYADLTTEQINTISTVKQQKENYQNAIDYIKAQAVVYDVESAYTGSDKDAKLARLKELMKKGDLGGKFVDADGKEISFPKNAKGMYEITDENGQTVEMTEEGVKAWMNEKKPEFRALSDEYESLLVDFKLAGVSSTGEIAINENAIEEYKKSSAIKEELVKNADSHLTALLTQADTAIADAGGNSTEVLKAIEKFTAEMEYEVKSAANTLAGFSKVDKVPAGMTAEEIAEFMEKADNAKDVVNGLATPVYQEGARKIQGTDAIIYVNGAQYTGDSNTFSVNGMTITATGVTGEYNPYSSDVVQVNVNTDTQGIYDKVKDFLSQYNSLINEMTALYNAASAKGYEPLTSEEKDSMSDSEVEKWEEKIKDSLLRRDNTLSGLINTMTSAMSRGAQVNGKTYYLSDFGIKTLGFLNAPKNEHNAYHIDGDEDDVNTSGATDKLMAAIAEDPDSVIGFMKELSSNLYKDIDAKMKSTSMSSSYTVYNDKEMASEYSDYTSLITKWQDRLAQQEEYYYNKFAQMESAMAKLNSQSSSLSGFFGM